MVPNNMRNIFSSYNFSILNTQRAVAVVSWVTEDELLPRGGGGGLQMITNVELINFSVGNAYCQYLEEHFLFHTFFSKLNTQGAVC